MSRRIPVLVAVLCCWAVACGPAEEQMEGEPAAMAMVDMAAEIQALTQADLAYSAVSRTKDIEAGLALHAPEIQVYPPDSPMLTGLDALREMFTSFLEDPNFSANFEPVSIVVSKDADMGYTLNVATLTVTGPDGEPMTERVNDLHIWRKQEDGSWKVVLDIWNALPPEEGM